MNVNQAAAVSDAHHVLSEFLAGGAMAYVCADGAMVPVPTPLGPAADDVDVSTAAAPDDVVAALRLYRCCGLSVWPQYYCPECGSAHLRVLV